MVQVHTRRAPAGLTARPCSHMTRRLHDAPSDKVVSVQWLVWGCGFWEPKPRSRGAAPPDADSLAMHTVYTVCTFTCHDHLRIHTRGLQGPHAVFTHRRLGTGQIICQLCSSSTLLAHCIIAGEPLEPGSPRRGPDRRLTTQTAQVSAAEERGSALVPLPLESWLAGPRGESLVI